MITRRPVEGLSKALFCMLAIIGLPGISSQPATGQDISCVKPLVIPDRWQDEDGDGHYDHAEPLTVDINGNGQYDPAQGDQYNDLNKDGTFDDTDEFYDPIATGYLAPGDVGLPLILMADPDPGPIVPGELFPVAFPAINRGDPLTGADAFAQWLAECAPFDLAVSDSLLLEPGPRVDTVLAAFMGFINEDPSAYWDDATESVQGSQFTHSPRVMTLLAFDPELFPASGSTTVILTKSLSLFLVSIGPGSQINTRIVDAGLGVPAPTVPTTWGLLKNRY